MSPDDCPGLEVLPLRGFGSQLVVHLGRTRGPRAQSPVTDDASDPHVEGLLQVVLPERVLDRRRIGYR